MLYTINEKGMFTPTITMYHGSWLDLQTLKPMAFNNGHKFRKCSWSIFFWPQYDLAYKWAIFVTVKAIARGTEPGIHTMGGRHFKTGFNTYGFEMHIHENEYEIALDYVNKAKPKFYIYIVKVPIDKDFSVGNNRSQPEFTYDSELEIYSKDIFVLDENIFRKNVIKVDDKKYEKILEYNKSNNNIRGLLGYIFEPTPKVMEKWKYVYKGIHSGKYKPGDNLDEIMKEYEEESGNQL